MTIAYAIGRDGERIPLEETDRRTEHHAERTDITIIAESSILADPVTIERVEWNDPFGVDWTPEYGPDAYSGQLPVTLLPGHTFGIEQQFYVKGQTSMTPEQERIDAIRNRYRVNRAKRLAPKVPDKRRWHPVAELYLPLSVTTVAAILNVLEEDIDGLTVRPSEVTRDIIYIGSWDPAPKYTVESIAEWLTRPDGTPAQDGDLVGPIAGRIHAIPNE